MAGQLSEIVEQKARVLEDLRLRFESLLERAEDSRKKKQLPSLPEFEAFGWGHFGEFLDRLEDALNTPLLEEARDILDKIGIDVNLQIVDKLKSGLSVRRENLVRILQEMDKGLKEIQNEDIQFRAKQDVTGFLEEGKWDDLITRVTDWYTLLKNLEPITVEQAKNTHLYNAVFEVLLQEGPSTEIIDKLKEIEDKASRIGGQPLAKQIKFEAPESQANPLRSVESNLAKIAERKEDIRQLRGENIEVVKFIEESTSFKKVIENLEQSYKVTKETYDCEQDKAKKLLEKYNNLATVLERTPRSMPSQLPLKALEQFNSEIIRESESLAEQLEKSLTSDTRVFIQDLFEGQLPKNWEADRIVKALEEILNKGFSFEVKRRE